MKIGIPKEIKPFENRVGMTPSGVKEIVKEGHIVYVQTDAGKASDFYDDDYKQAGALILPTIEEVYHSSEMIIKVKEPVESEYHLVKENQLLFTYFHFASNKVLTRAMIKQKAVCISYETVETLDKKLPLLIPMSEVAGRMATQEGAKYLERTFGGRGLLLGGVPGVPPAKVLIIGGGVVGTQAAKIAAGMGADVTIMDLNIDRLRQLDEIMPANVKTMVPSEMRIREVIPNMDLIIGAVLIHGAKSPMLITRDMLPTLKQGTVLVDVAIDQGGCFETSRPTTHQEPTYIVDNIIHYAVTNMPGAVPFTSTLALTNATLPYALELAEKGWIKASKENPAIKLGLNIINGKVVYKAVSDAFGIPYTPAEDVLK